MELVCRMEPMDESVPSAFLPDGKEVILGRTPEMNIQNVYCSRQQLACVADYKEQIVYVTVCGRAKSVVDKKVLEYGESCYATHCSIVELVKGGHKYRVVFSECRKREKSEDRDTDPETEPIPKPETKKPAVFTWEQLCNGEVLQGTHSEFVHYKKKVAAFDLDGTLIKTKSGNVFPKNMDDWTVWHESVKPALFELHENGYQVVIFTNQASLSMPKGKMLLKDFKKKVETIIGFLEVPVSVYISTSSGYYRKPAPGMWELMICKMSNAKFNMMESFYVGDAAGRPENWKPGKKADFSSSDRMFALNTDLKFLTPEEFFLKEQPVVYPEIKFHPGIYEDNPNAEPEYSFPDSQEVILMVGSPASGKSHFVRSFLFRKQYHPVSRDNLGTWQKCVATLKKLLEAKKKVVVDNTNPDVASRQRYIEVCKQMNVPVRCFMMTTSLDRCLHNNKFRQITDSSHSAIKSQVINHYHTSFEPPTLEEGFTEILEIPFIPFFPDSELEQIYNYHLLA